MASHTSPLGCPRWLEPTTAEAEWEISHTDGLIVVHAQFYPLREAYRQGPREIGHESSMLIPTNLRIPKGPPVVALPTVALLSDGMLVAGVVDVATHLQVVIWNLSGRKRQITQGQPIAALAFLASMPLDEQE